MKKVDYSKKEPNVDPMVKYMNKKVTVRMLLAHFNSLPNLLRYVSSKTVDDIYARIALHNFITQAKSEKNVMEPCEAVYGFAANLLKLGKGPEDSEDHEQEKITLAKLAADFCIANDLGTPEPNWTERLKFVIPEEPLEK